MQRTYAELSRKKALVYIDPEQALLNLPRASWPENGRVLSNRSYRQADPRKTSKIRRDRDTKRSHKASSADGSREELLQAFHCAFYFTS